MRSEEPALSEVEGISCASTLSLELVHPSCFLPTPPRKRERPRVSSLSLC